MIRRDGFKQLGALAGALAAQKWLTCQRKRGPESCLASDIP
jgi:hypothetical protein